ncbi:MAG: hypothetical protein WBP79_07620, partial [Candidatus Acidiferrales bacterium]
MIRPQPPKGEIIDPVGRLRIIAERGAIIAIALLVLVYVSDFLLIEYRARSKNPAVYGTVQFERYYS